VEKAALVVMRSLVISFFGHGSAARSLHFGPVSGITADGGAMKKSIRLSVALISLLLFSLVILGIVHGQSEVQPSDTQAYYKAKCVVCHGQKAEKKFDTALTEEQHLEAIMKGKKPEKPPNMPAYGEKGVTAEQAKALLDYMKQLRTTQ
jgi:mono/diheme cytochrome c family protein